MKKIICFGEALIDFLPDPAQRADGAKAFLRNAGGAPANVAVALAQLGADSHFVGMLGADMFGDFLLESLQQAGVQTAGVRRTSAANTALAFVSLDARGERSFAFYRPPAADLLFAEADFSAASFAGLAAFHCCSNSLTEAPIAAATLAGIAAAQAAGALVSFDLNWRPALWPAGSDAMPRLWQVLAQANVVKLSKEEFELLGEPQAALARLWQGRAELVVVTDGPAPLHWFTRAGGGHYAAPAVAAVDTTGAGDAFTAGLLTMLAEQEVRPGQLAVFAADPARMTPALRFAAACGALAVSRHGAFAAMPRRADVLDFLENH